MTPDDLADTETIMSDGRRQTIDLFEEDALFVEEKVASGAFHSARDVIHAGLSALRETDAEMGRWILDEVVPVYDRLMDDPSLAIPAKQGFAELRARYSGDRQSGD